MEMKNKPVSATDLKNKAKRNKEKQHKQRMLEQQLRKDKKQFDAQFNLNVPKAIREVQEQ